jgi:hypothetical protein
LARSFETRKGQSRYKVHPGFPATVRDFWQLKGKSKFAFATPFPPVLIVAVVSTLQQLAKHYLPGGWESWGRDDPDNSDATDLAEMELAVATYPEFCLRALAENWSLEYRHLQRPGAGLKRKAENEPELRETKVRKVGEGYEEISLHISHDSEDILVRRMTRSKADVIHTGLTLRVLSAGN